MRKREARLERAAEKRLKQEEKSARLRDTPVDGKKPRTGANPDSIFHQQMSWTCENADHDGVWSWGTARKWEDAHWDEAVKPKLGQWEKLTWAEIDSIASGSGHKMHHTMDVDVITDEAQLRLMELDKIEASIFRFRLGNKPRLWGFRRVAEFHVLWYDPDHKIYPVEPE